MRILAPKLYNHRFTDRDADGKFNSPDEVSFLVSTNISSSLFVSRLDVSVEDGWPVGYFLDFFTDSIYRGIDLDGDGQIAGPSEFRVYRDSGDLDGNSNPEDLSLTDDGALWWSAALAISFPHNGVSRIVDLNGDGDGADPGEQVLMIDGNAGHAVEHDAGSGPIAAWALQTVSAAGDGVMAFAGADDHAVYRFEDLNADGDLTDAGESILLLNATGARADFPMQPDFADGTLRSLSLPPAPPFDEYARFTHLSSGLENGERSFYFGTDALENSPFFTPNINGEGMNFLIFRGVDLNGDRDVNDAGEVTLFRDGSNTSGTPNLGTMRALKAVDGGRVFAVGDRTDPYNSGIHEFRDLNGDGDAEDIDELELGVFNLELHGATEFFPGLLGGSLFADPVDIAFSPRLYFEPSFSVSGSGCSFPFGAPPTATALGSGLLGTQYTLRLDGAAPLSPALWTFGISTSSWFGNPLPLDLEPFGYTDCSLYHNLIGSLPAPTDGIGHAEVSGPLPSAPSLAGVALPSQWFVVGPGSLQSTGLGSILLK